MDVNGQLLVPAALNPRKENWVTIAVYKCETDLSYN